MKKQIVLIILILSLVLYTPLIQNVSAQDVIIIDSMGITPENMGVNITESGIYILTKNIDVEIIVSKSDIIFDGNGYSVNAGLTIDDASNVTLRNHVFSGLIGDELFIVSSDDIYIIDNEFIETNIVAQQSSYIEISGNTIETFGYGIYCDYLEHSTISENEISSVGSGIFLVTSNYITATGNILSKKAAGPSVTASVTMQFADNNIFTYNIFQNFEYGLHMQISNNNQIYGNRFIDITRKAASIGESYDTSWDNNNKGNYYSDYNELYPTANPIGDIMDTPYRHDTDNIDYYPLLVEDSTSPVEKKPITISLQDSDPDADGDSDKFWIRGSITPKYSGIELLVEINPSTLIDYDGMGSTTPPLIVTTDANGEFEFSADIGIEEGFYRTVITYAGNETYEGYSVYWDTEIIKSQIPRGNIKITIKEDDSTLSGVTVTSTSEPNNQADLIGSTNNQGIYQFDDVLVGSYTFKLEKDGYTSKTTSLQCEIGQTKEIIVNLVKEQTNETGGGIPGFPIESLVLSIMMVSIIMWMMRKKN